MRLKLKHILLLTCILIIQSCQSNKSKDSTTVDINEESKTGITNDSTIETLKTFYTDYATEFCKEDDVDEDKLASLREKYLSKNLIAKLDSISINDFIDADPILCAQDFAEEWISTFQFKPDNNMKDVYDFCYCYNTSEGSKSYIKLYLIKEDGIFKINKIEYQMPEDSEN